MKIIRPFQIASNTQVLEQNRKFRFIVSATLGISLETGQALLDFDYLKKAFSRMGEKPVPDSGMPKPFGEFLISGSYYSPGGKAVTGAEVRVRLGAMEKRLYVFGPRQWANGTQSTPQPISVLPLDYAHAFGGKEYLSNPDGIGYRDGQLPCIEYPGKLVMSDKDTPDPAGFAPLSASWPQRMRFQPRYDSSYLKKCFPGYPENLDWRFFQAAPQDQWAEGFFKGDEAFEICNMHPDAPVLSGKLPGLYCRCFIKQSSHVLTELSMHLDTIWFFPEEFLCLQIWRGGMEVADDEAEQISHVILAYENSGHEPRTRAHYCDALDKRCCSNDPFLNSFNTEDLIATGDKCAMEQLQEMACAGSAESELAKNLNAKALAVRKMADEKIQQAIGQAQDGIEKADISLESKADLLEKIQNPSAAKADPDIEKMHHQLESIMPGITSGDIGKMELKNFSFDKIDQMVDVVSEMSEKKQKAGLETAKIHIAEIKAKLAAEATGKTVEDPEDTVAEALQAFEQINSGSALPSVPLPRLCADEILGAYSSFTPQVTAALTHVQSARAAGLANSEVEKLELEVMKKLEDQQKQAADALRRAEDSFREVYFMGAHFMREGLSPHRRDIAVVTQEFMNDFACGKSLKGKDWACIDLQGKNLDGIDLSATYLEQVDFRGASLKGANFTDAILCRAMLEGADLTGADFTHANLGAVLARNACFAGAKLECAVMSKGDFSGADLSHCDFCEADILDTNFSGANLAHANIPSALFIKTTIASANFAGALMTGAVFAQSTVSDVEFSGADLSGSIWAETPLERVRFDGATMKQACFASPEPAAMPLKGCSFAGADIGKANFQGMLMAGADLHGASADNANFAGTDLSGAKLEAMDAPNAQFRKANLAGANLDRINLMNGSLAKAKLANASCKGANFFSVDFLRSHICNTDLSGSNLDNTILEGWQPK